MKKVQKGISLIGIKQVRIVYHLDDMNLKYKILTWLLYVKEKTIFTET